MVTEEEFLKEHPSLKGRIFSIRINKHDRTSMSVKGIDDKGELIYSSEPIEKIELMKYSSLENIHKTQIDKQKVKEIIDKLIEKSNDIYVFVDDKKREEVELFGNDKRELREKGYMRWAFEDGGSEALIQLKKELGVD